MTNWKTTLAGVLAIIAAVASAAKAYLSTGSIPDITAIGAAVSAGVGLIVAQDSAKKHP